MKINMKTMNAIWRMGVVCLLLLTSCNLPFGGAQGTPLPDPASLPPMPPAVVETVPAAGSQIPLQSAISFYFNQPMDPASVEAAWSVFPVVPGVLAWQGDSILVFTPSQPLPAGTDLTFTVDITARSESGQTPLSPLVIAFRTVDALSVLQKLPRQDSTNVVATSAVAASFNQPVVALGGDASTMPVGFTLEPSAAGSGEWINTSTYIFYPAPALAGGITYTATVNPDLVAVTGSAMDAADSWTFTVAPPSLLTLEPESELALPLDTEFVLTFNQPMDPASVERAFSLNGPDGRVYGSITWDEHETIMTFTPTALLQRNADYALILSLEAQGRGGTPIDRSTTYFLRTYPDFDLASTDPQSGGIMEYYQNPDVIFTAPPQEDVEEFITISPDAGTIYTYVDGTTLSIGADFLPQTDYVITISSSLPDRWGQSLGEQIVVNFRTAAASPSLLYPYVGGTAYYVRAATPDFYAQVVNIPFLDLQLGSIPLDDFFYLVTPGNWQAREYYQSVDPTFWRQYIPGTPNVNEMVPLQIPQGGGALEPGIYYFHTATDAVQYDPSPEIIVASDVNLTLKIGASEVLLWAVDLRTNEPVSGAAARLVSANGSQLASGTTDANGLWQAPLVIENLYDTFYAVLGEPGEDTFSLVSSDWDQDISPWDFGYARDMGGVETDIYFYTDRPIYRPGQTVYFRTVVRESFDGTYNASELGSIAFAINNDSGDGWDYDLPLSQYGTASGELQLPEDARPGTYYISSMMDDVSFYFSFIVAEYVKPEINLSVAFAPQEVENGQDLQAQVNARYFFDAPSGSLPVEWTLYAEDGYFHLPDYRVGAFADRWLNQDYDYDMYVVYGDDILSGEGITGPDGTLTIDIAAADLPQMNNLTCLTLEVTARDESGQYTSARTTAQVHPADFYIGVHPNVWIGQAGRAIDFELLAVDWEGEADGTHTLNAVFNAVIWERSERVTSYGVQVYNYIPRYTEIARQDFATATDGTAQLQFTPPSAGTYMLDVSGGGAHTQVLLWVGGTSQAVWPNLPHDQVTLTADRDSYQVGDTAQVFIPNPLGSQTIAFVTMERDTVHSTEVLYLGPSGTVLSLPLTTEDAPNIYISATLIGGGDFLQGYLNLTVDDPQRVLNVALTSTPQQAGPREPVTFSLHVSDAQGAPVQGEFSLAVVDLAALALADPNSLQIVEYYTRAEELGMDTAISLAADPSRGVIPAGGMGGGGGNGGMIVREDFPDTAYWNGSIVTDASGNATVSMTLPDNLTTWFVDVRGVTTDTRVGQASTELVTTKELLVRPVTPLFLVAGDHVQVGAVIHNNTDDKLVVKATLQAVNFNLDRTPKQTQKVTIKAGERALVTWWGAAQDASSAELTFSVQSGSLNDASMPVNGALPILRYTTPQTYNTAGILGTEGTKLEAVSLPRSFDPGSGSLTVELSPSLAADLLSGLDALKDPPVTASNEYLASYLLPNLAVYRALQDAGLEDAALQERAGTRLQTVLNRLASHQNYNDGGWAWFTTADSQWDYDQTDSDPYLSAYILFGLHQAQQAGFEVEIDHIERAREFLQNEIQDREGYDGELDRWALINFVLDETGGGDGNVRNTLTDNRELLESWAQALLALSLERSAPGSSVARELLGDLESTAIRSASGASWESTPGYWMNPSSTLVTTAMVVYALSRQDPASPLLADAVRFLSYHRSADGMWGSTYETAWVILALNTYMVGTGGYAADYSFSATLNNQPLAQGTASGPSTLTPVISTVPVTNLLPEYPNALAIQRGAGAGSLYYRAALQVFQPVETVPALNKGIGIERNFYLEGCSDDCSPLHEVSLSEGTPLVVSLTLSLPHDAYYLMVEDTLPAGAQVLNTNLKTSQQGEGSGISFEDADAENPFISGWGWWFFSEPLIYDDHITWSVEYLSAGTYVLTYTLIPMQAGEFRVIPARAWMSFFPDVQGRSAGEILTIVP